MQEYYLKNFQELVSSIIFVGFKVILTINIFLLIISLIILIIGCLIKSQKIKSKFLKIVPKLFLSNTFILIIPYILVYLRNIL